MDRRVHGYRHGAASGILSAKEVELLSIVLDASYIYMCAVGARRHIKNALAAGATMEEIMLSSRCRRETCTTASDTSIREFD